LELKKYIDYIAKDKGDGDIFYTHSTSKTIRMGCLDGKVFLEEVSSKETSGYGVRIFKEGRTGFSFGNKTDEESVLQTIDYAEQASQLGEPLAVELPRNEGKQEESAKSERDLNEILETISEIFLSKGVKKFEATAGIETSFWQLVNTAGTDVTSSESGYSVVVMPVVSGEGENANYWFSVTNDPQTLDLNEIVLRSLNRAYSSLDGKSMSFKGLPVVFDSLEWAELLGFLLDSFGGKNVERQKSYFSGKVGQRVLSEHLSLKLENSHPKVLGKYFFDHEGVSVKPAFLLKDGTFVEPYYGLAAAAEFGKEPTGVGHRFSFRTQPNDVPFICHVQVQGLPSLDSLDKYLLVTSLKGIHSGLNAVSGAFSIGADGTLVSGAERVPLSGITLSGNIWDVLNNIIAATPEEEAVPSSTWLVSPLVALDGITVTG